MLKPRPYTYYTRLKWGGRRMGTASSDGKPDIGVACPPEFGGHEGLWSPEDLFLASVELCIMTTFLWLLNKHGLSIVAYKSAAEGTAQISQNIFVFKKIVVRPVVTIADKSHKEDTEKLFRETAELCLISSSIKSEVKIEATVLVNANGM